MNKSIKNIVLIAGVFILLYGIYTLIQPETKVAIGNTSLFESQDNTNSYITMVIGIVAIALGFYKGK